MITIVLATVAALAIAALVVAFRSERVGDYAIDHVAASFALIVLLPPVAVGATAFAIASLFTPLS